MNTLMVVAISLIVALAILFVFLIRVGSGRSTRLPYEQAGPLLTPAERNFFGVLKQVVRDGYLITFKVRIGDVLKVRKGLDRKQAFAMRIDFLPASLPQEEASNYLKLRW